MLCYYPGSGVTVTSGQALPIFSLGGSTSNGLGLSSTNGRNSEIGFPSSKFGPAIPPKRKKKILDIEFVDMSELLPDGWRQQEDETRRCCITEERTCDRHHTVGRVLCNIGGGIGREIPHESAQEDEIRRCCITEERTCDRHHTVGRVLVGVLAEKYPMKVPGLMSHMKCVLKASRSYQGEAWVSYDIAYRRQAAYRKSLDGFFTV